MQDFSPVGNHLPHSRAPSLAFAILFPMEEVFEAYIAHMMKKSIPDANVSAQDKKYSLFDRTNETKAGYRLRPDLVVRFEDNRTTIADTKWKVLDSTGPSQTVVPDVCLLYKVSP